MFQPGGNRPILPRQEGGGGGDLRQQVRRVCGLESDHVRYCQYQPAVEQTTRIIIIFILSFYSHSQSALCHLVTNYLDFSKCNEHSVLTEIYLLATSPFIPGGKSLEEFYWYCLL